MTTEHSVHFIAEGGCNHNGSLVEAKRMVDAALAGGADSFKVQLTYPDSFLLPVLEDGVSPNPGYISRGEITLSEADHRSLAEYCRNVGMAFSASAFDFAGVDMLVSVGAPYIKISSGDLTHFPLLTHAASSGLRVILSTGMSKLSEIEDALEVLVKNGAQYPVLMHCVSVYPSPLERMNIDFLDVLRNEFGMPLGLSDHSKSDIPVIAAVAKGVKWVEKHFTLDNKQQGVDHAISLEPQEMTDLIEAIRTTEAVCHLQETKVGDQELQVRQRARRGLYAARDLPKGHVLTQEDVLVVRPESEFSPVDCEQLMQKALSRPVAQYSAFRRDDFS